MSYNHDTRECPVLTGPELLDARDWLDPRYSPEDHELDHGDDDVPIAWGGLIFVGFCYALMLILTIHETLY